MHTVDPSHLLSTSGKTHSAPVRSVCLVAGVDRSHARKRNSQQGLCTELKAVLSLPPHGISPRRRVVVGRAGLLRVGRVCVARDRKARLLQEAAKQRQRAVRVVPRRATSHQSPAAGVARTRRLTRQQQGGATWLGSATPRLRAPAHRA
eukprot:461596-Prymnesium_polylepis.1